MSNKRGVEINAEWGGRGWRWLENVKLNSRGGVDEILFHTLKQYTKKLKCFELQMIGETHQIHQ